MICPVSTTQQLCVVITNKTRLKIHHGDIDFDLEDSPILMSNEGTSAQDSVSAAGSSTQSGSWLRSAKAKGKEPDVAQPLTMSEDKLE